MGESHHHVYVRSLRLKVNALAPELTGVSRRIESYTTDMRREDVDRSLTSAMKMWSDAAPLKFVRIKHESADIVLSFARRSKPEHFCKRVSHSGSGTTRALRTLGSTEVFQRTCTWFTPWSQWSSGLCWIPGCYINGNLQLVAKKS